MSPGEAIADRGPPGARIGRPLPIVVAASLVAAWAAAVDADWARLAFDCALGWSLLALAWIDWHRMRLPDLLTLPVLILGLAATSVEATHDLFSSVVGAAAGYCALRLIDWGYRGLRGREGLGQGDAKLLAAGGAWLGWEALPGVVLVAAALGLALALFHHARGTRLKRETALPFGPPLALAIWIGRMHGIPGT